MNLSHIIDLKSHLQALHQDFAKWHKYCKIIVHLEIQNYLVFPTHFTDLKTVRWYINWETNENYCLENSACNIQKQSLDFVLKQKKMDTFTNFSELINRKICVILLKEGIFVATQRSTFSEKRKNKKNIKHYV